MYNILVALTIIFLFCTCSQFNNVNVYCVKNCDQLESFSDQGVLQELFKDLEVNILRFIVLVVFCFVLLFLILVILFIVRI